MRFIVFLAAVLVIQDKPTGYASTKEAMMKVQLVVGEWRCTGEPKELKRERWQEKSSWAFKIDKEKNLYELAVTITDGVFWKDGVLGYDVEKKVFTFAATLVAGEKRSYSGTLVEKQKELTLEQTGDTWPRERVVFSLLRDNRFLITVETCAAKGRDWSPQAVLGCTKEGVDFVKGGGIVCIVTGGGGSIPVTYKDKTYYVCCSGCKSFFNDDPEKTIAAAKKAGWIKE